MEDWKECKLGDVCDFQEGYVNPPQSNPEYFDGDIKWLRATDLNDGYVYSTTRTLTQLGFRSAKKSAILFKPGTIAISKSGTIGRLGILQDYMCGNRAVINIIPHHIVNTFFLFCVLRSYQRHFPLMAVGIVQKNLYISILEDLKISLPDLNTQERIVSILKSLDDKIECNRRINENLEQQAQALFKSWFVDFEPFKDQPFVDSELGMIPHGWRVGRYEDIIDSTISGDWGKEKAEGNYTHKVACIRGCDFQDIKNGLRGKTPERYILEKNYQTKHFKDKDVLVEISGGTATVSTGRVCPVSQLLIDKYGGDIVCTNFCRLVRSKEHYGAYLYYSWLFKYNNKVMFGYENGTSGIKNFRIKDFVSLEPIIIPSEDSLIRFQSFINQLQIKLQMNGSEIQKLAELRDTLLPKLMSGEINVNEVKL